MTTQAWITLLATALAVMTVLFVFSMIQRVQDIREAYHEDDEHWRVRDERDELAREIATQRTMIDEWADESNRSLVRAFRANEEAKRYKKALLASMRDREHLRRENHMLRQLCQGMDDVMNGRAVPLEQVKKELRT